MVLAGLLFLASLASLLLRKAKLPFSVGLVVLGAGLHNLAPLAGVQSLASFHVSPDVIVYVLLPALLFEASFNMDSRRLVQDLAPITVLAVAALLISAGIVGAVLHLALGVPLTYTLLFGALISATDPVAVLAIFKELGAPKRLALLVDGESLFNDGTALVLFRVLLALALAGSLTWDAVPQGVASFLWVFLGGTGLGIAAGWLFSQIIGRVEEEPMVEITLAVTLAYGSFLLADHFLHVSGVMATVGAGLTLGNHGRTKISPAVLGHMEAFWEYAAFVVNALVFLFMGLSIAFGSLLAYAGAIAWAVAAALLGRAVAIFVLIPLMNRWLRESISRAYQGIMWWGGLRGALAVAMVLSIPEDVGFRPLLLNLTFGVVVFTLLVAAPTMRPLIQLLGLTRYTLEEAFQKQAGLLLTGRATAAKLADLQRHEMVSGRVARAVGERQATQWESVRHNVDALRQAGFGEEAEIRTLRGHCLLVEARLFSSLFVEGGIDEPALKDLRHGVQQDLDALKWGIPGRRGWTVNTGTGVAWLADRIAPLRRKAEQRRAERLARSYEEKRARFLAAEVVLEELRDIGESAGFSAAAVHAVSASYQGRMDRSRRELELFGDQFPEYAEKAQTIVARRFALRAEVGAFAELHEAGVVSDRAAQEVTEEVRRELGSLRKQPVEALLLPHRVLLQRVPFFESLPAAAAEELARRLKPLFFEEGERVIEEGNVGKSLYLIGRGVVSVSAGPVEMTTLRAGDFFGEMALLTDEPRNASVTCLTPCHLLELRRRDLERLARMAPAIGAALNAAYGERVLPNRLAHVPYFQRLPAEERLAVVRRFEGVSCRRAEVLWEASSGTACMLFVKTGGVRVERDGAAPQVLRPGALFVSHAADGQPAATALVAEQDGEVLRWRS